MVASFAQNAKQTNPQPTSLPVRLGEEMACVVTVRDANEDTNNDAIE
jgi:hypothetical protein